MSTPGKPQFRLDVSRTGPAAVVTVAGSVSMAAAEPLRETLEELAREQTPVIVVDMTRMDFICSLGLGAIINAHLKCRHHDGRLRLAGATPSVRDLLHTTRLDKLFGVYDSVEDAMAGN
jgi:anti-sigma B factor antagonist